MSLFKRHEYELLKMCIAQREMTAHHADYSAAMRLGRNLKDRCTKNDPEREVLSGMLDQLKSKWNSLRALTMQRFAHRTVRKYFHLRW